MVLQGLKPLFMIRVEMDNFHPRKRWTNLETKFLEVRHMLGLNLNYFGLPNSKNSRNWHFQTHLIQKLKLKCISIVKRRDKGVLHTNA